MYTEEVGAARQDPRKVLSKSEISRHEKAFREIDADHSGLVDAKELMGVLKKLGTKMSIDDAQKMIASADESRDGQLSFDEFLVCMTEKKAGWQLWWKGGSKGRERSRTM